MQVIFKLSHSQQSKYYYKIWLESALSNTLFPEVLDMYSSDYLLLFETFQHLQLTLSDQSKSYLRKDEMQALWFSNHVSLIIIVLFSCEQMSSILQSEPSN